MPLKNFLEIKYLILNGFKKDRNIQVKITKGLYSLSYPLEGINISSFH